MYIVHVYIWACRHIFKVHRRLFDRILLDIVTVEDRWVPSIAGALHLALSLFVIRNKFIVNQVRVVCPREYVLSGKPLLQPARYVSFFKQIDK